MKIFGSDKKEEREKFTGLDDESLEKILNAMKIIAKIKNKEEALENVDKITYQLVNQLSDEVTIDDDEEEKEYEEEIEKAKEEIEKFKKEIEKLKKKMKAADIDDDDIEDFESLAEDLDEYWERKIKKKFKKEVKYLKDEALKVIEEARKVYHIQNIDNALKVVIHSISSVERIIEELNEAYKYLLNNKLFNDEYKDKIRKGKERAIWFRAKKKLDDADVAEGGQNLKKAEKLRGEAKILIKQDWIRAFPDEEPPVIN